MEETKKQKRSNLMNRSAFKNTKISSPEAVTVKHTPRSIQLTTDTLSNFSSTTHVLLQMFEEQLEGTRLEPPCLYSPGGTLEWIPKGEKQ